MFRGYAPGNRVVHRRFHRVDTVTDQRVNQPALIAHFATGHAPDKRTVTGVVLFNPRFLLDDLRTVQSETRFAGHNQVAAQRRRDGHPTEAAHGPCDNPDNGRVTTQVNNRRVDIGNGGQTQVRLLQTNAAGFEAQHSLSRNAVAVIFCRQLQRRRHFGTGHFTHAAALERTFNGDHNGWLTVDRAFRHHHAVVRLRNNALWPKPRRDNAFKRIQQFAIATLIEQGLRTLACFQFDKAAVITHGSPPQKPVRYECEPRPASRRNHEWSVFLLAGY